MKSPSRSRIEKHLNIAYPPTVFPRPSPFLLRGLSILQRSRWLDAGSAPLQLLPLFFVLRHRHRRPHTAAVTSSPRCPTLSNQTSLNPSTLLVTSPLSLSRVIVVELHPVFAIFTSYRRVRNAYATPARDVTTHFDDSRKLRRSFFVRSLNSFLQVHHHNCEVN